MSLISAIEVTIVMARSTYLESVGVEETQLCLSRHLQKGLAYLICRLVYLEMTSYPLLLLIIIIIFPRVYSESFQY